ncbi:MAG: hypothetical protein QXG00_08775 [Candidatus Woesearchaeota archaeon]
MAEKNDRDEARVIIKKIVDFNITNDYYVKDKKDELAREFKKLLYVDDQTVRRFLEKWFSITKTVASEFDLLGTSTEVEKAEEEKTSEEETEEKEETEEEEEKEKEETEEEEEKEETEEKEEKETSTEEEETEEEIPKLEHKIYESYINRASELV